MPVNVSLKIGESFPSIDDGSTEPRLSTPRSHQAQNSVAMPFCWVDTQVISDYGSRLGAEGLGVYLKVCSLIGEGDAAFPDEKTLAAELKIGPRKLKLLLKLLEDLSLIERGVKRIEKDNETFYVYTIGLLDSVERKKEREKKISQEYVETSYKNKNKDRIVRSGYVYILVTSLGCKIGRTKYLYGRMKSHVTSCPVNIHKIYSAYVEDYTKEEKRIHKAFEHKRIRSEWFVLGKEDIDRIIKAYGMCLYGEENTQ